jgi:hypothetical protein
MWQTLGGHVTKAAVLDAAYLLYCSFSYGYVLTVQTWIKSSIAEERASFRELQQNTFDIRQPFK